MGAAVEPEEGSVNAAAKASEPEPTVAAAAQDENILGKYRLVAKLGYGGMAEVFLAMARGPASFSKLVVLKRLRDVVSDKEEHVAMFLDEARLAARLNHPNIVHTYEVGEIDGQYFIVMEYLEGQPLNRIFKELVLGKTEKGEVSPFTVSCALRVVIDVLMGLQSAHDLKDYDGTLLNVVHRDISPHNVFVTYEGAVKIVDFGIAKAAVNSTETETGILKGKVAYMAPEQALCSKTLDHRADLYSVGVVLWELLAGKRLYDGPAVQVLQRVIKDPAPLLSTEVPDIPKDLEEIVAKALAREPANRYSSALEMRQAIEGYLKQHALEARTEEVREVLDKHFQARREQVQRQIKDQVNRVMTGAVVPAEGNLDVGTFHGALSGSYSSLKKEGSTQSLRASVRSLPNIDDSSSGSRSNIYSISSASGSVPSAEVLPPKSNKGLMIALGAAGLVIVALLSIGAMSLRSTPKPAASATALAPGEGAVHVTTNPPEAMVSWNGQSLGKTPLRAPLPPGNHTLVLSLAGHHDETVIVTIASTATTEETITLKKREAPAVGAVVAVPSEASAPKPYVAAATPHWRPTTPATTQPATATPAPQPPPPATTAAPSKPNVQVLDNDNKPKANVNIVQ